MNSSSTAPSRRGVILDRDGIINREVGYLHRVEHCVFVEGIFPLLQAFQARGFRLVIATNQSGIGRGYFSEEDFQTLMGWMLGEIGRHGVTIERVYHCPFHPTEGIGAYRRDSDCRKPRPGMFLSAIRDLGLDPSVSWAVGDNERDMEAASAARIGRRVLVDPSGLPGERPDGVAVVPGLFAVRELLEREG